MKPLAAWMLLALVALTVGCWGWSRWFGAAPAAAGGVASPEPLGPEHIVRVTYFTTDSRCPTCREIEALTRRTVEDRFGAEASAGRVVFELRNLDQAENAHFADDYAIAFKTVVLSDRWDGAERSWRKMDAVWQLVGDPEAFMDYLGDGITALLNEPS